MSWYPSNSASSSNPGDQPTHAGLYVSDLENYCLQSYHTPYAPAYNGHPMFTPMDLPQYHQSNAVGPVQHYPVHADFQNGHSNSHFSSMPVASGYDPHMPGQPTNNPMDMANVPDFGHDQNYFHHHHNHQNNSNVSNKRRGRGNNNSYKTGFKVPYENYNHDMGLEFHSNNNAFRGNHRNNRGNRGNSRGQRGHQDMAFQPRNARPDNNDHRYKQTFHSKEKDRQERSDPSKAIENRKKQNNADKVDDSGEYKYNKDSLNDKLSNISTKPFTPQNGPDYRYKKMTPNVSQRKQSENKMMNHSGVADNIERMGNESGRTQARSGNNSFFEGKREKGNMMTRPGNYNGKGARPKQVSKWDNQAGDKDENQRGSLTEQLSRNAYECMVCCEIIKVESAIWSCHNCYHVFHLHCTKKWAHSSVDKESKLWRCPGCQNESSQIPSQYRCFCGRRKDPPFIRGETPHSCGDPCRKKKKGHCQHPCTILCHPGPCPPCSSMVNQPCDCGNQKKSMRCSVAASFKCDTICAKDLSCGEHQCMETCHSDSCQTCTVSKMQGCYCGKRERQVYCGKIEFEMISYSCEESCGRTLSCGNHVCEVACHPGDCAPCSSDPSILSTCCCGKTSLEQLDAVQRQSCLDPIPVCGQICMKPMACGPQDDHHLCEKLCHEGECGPCNKETSVYCQCSRMNKDFPCETAVTFDAKNPFKCQKRCGKKKNCGRHKCSDNCCVKDFHICENTCGFKLNCGFHKCKELCHRGNCKRCLETSFEELPCFCGVTVMEPPIPCGTRPPECHQLCTRPQKCDHPVRHNCHMNEECAPCAELTEKMCMGGHMVRKNIPCHMKNISCGMPCNKQLACGMHQCVKVCHKGPCLPEGEPCTQLCPKPRQACSHPCGASCHVGDCPPTFCKTEILIMCRCGNRSTKMECQMGGDQSAEIAQFQRLSVLSIAESGSDGVDMSQFCQTKPGARTLDCDTSCAVMERNKRIALALEINNPDMSAKLGNSTFTDFLKDFAKKNSKFAMAVEKALSDLVQTSKKSPHPNRSHSFPSMTRDQRRFIHELSEFYGCQSQSYDFEPNKNVVATAHRDKCWLPNVTLTQLVFKDTTKAPPPLSGLKTQGVTFTVLEKKKPAPSAKEIPAAPSRAWETVSQPKPTSEAGAGAANRSAATPALDYFDFTEN